MSIVRATRPVALPASHYPSRDLVGIAAANLDRTCNPEADRQHEPGARLGLDETLVWDGLEGPRWFLTVAPGLVQVGSTDLARGERSLERQVRGRVVQADMLAACADPVTGELPAVRDPAEKGIVNWSRKSRANMTRRLSTLDYADLLASGDQLAMLTLTYPGDWLTVAPDGKAVKKHLEAFKMRWSRRFGSKIMGVWKMEFQRRGAPHFHLLISIPTHHIVKVKSVKMSLPQTHSEFRAWVSSAWADVVGHPDPVERMRHEQAGTGVDVGQGNRMTDPKRVAVYFTKHGQYGAKEYQNQPPEEWTGSVGRFWGVWGLEPALAVVPVTREQALVVTRTLRRWQRQNRYQRVATVMRVEQSTGRVRMRKTRKWVVRMPGSAGFLCVNDGPATAMMLDRLLSSRS